VGQYVQPLNVSFAVANPRYEKPWTTNKLPLKFYHFPSLEDPEPTFTKNRHSPQDLHERLFTNGRFRAFQAIIAQQSS
jgi:hypothetical protein